MKPQVVCIPGGVAPAAQRYGPLIAAAGEAADFHTKDLEVYRGATPPSGYSVEEEVEAIDRFAGANGLSRFHLIGYSGGGFISLAYAATRPERLNSLGIFEAARIPGVPTAEEAELRSGFERKLEGLRGPEFMAAFVREQLKPGVQAPAPLPGPPSPEMQKRPAGIAAMMGAFNNYQLDRELFRAVQFPVYYAYGDLSHPEQALKAGILGQYFADIHIHRFDGVHHFVPPEKIYTAEHVDALITMWHKTERSAADPSLQ